MNRKIKHLLILLFLLVASFLSFYLLKPAPVFAETMCCPEGFKDGFFDCPFFTDGSKCCRRLDFGSYDIVDKVSSTSLGAKGNFCCPLGYGTGGFDCPLGTDLTKQCCKRNGFMDYTKVDKISCTIPPACQVTPTIPPAPCASNMVNGSCTKISTGLGDISTTPSGLVRSLFGLILSISGGIALLLIIISGYKVLASQGNPEALKGAREQLTAAIVGLLFIILSLVILQVIGVDILRIPGFSSRSTGGGF